MLSVAWSATASAQLRLDPDVYPDVWNRPLEEDEEDKPPPPPPTYSGDPVRLPAACDGAVDASEQELEILGAVETETRTFVFGDYRTSNETLRSLLLVSEDAGASWMEAGEIVQAGALDAAAFVDADHGWIAGYSEEAPGRLRPFLLATTDGGATWRRWDVSPGSEERFGTVVDFRFDTAKHGYAVVERTAADADQFELYETFNAGRSWSIRLIVPEKPTIPGGRRILSTKTWSVELEDGAWSVTRGSPEAELIGRFASEVDACPAEQDEAGIPAPTLSTER